MKKKYLKFTLPLALFLLLITIKLVFAQGIIPNDSGQAETGNYTLNDFIKLAINISRWILGITGSLALLAFIYGGFTFLLSGGSSEKVAKGKQIIFGAIIGLIIVFASYTIIQFVLKSAGYIDEQGRIIQREFNTGGQGTWNKTPYETPNGAAF